MYIANPMYDSIFKYLLEDDELARFLISTIIGEEIVALDPNPQEQTTEIGASGNRFFTVYRLDFAARVRTVAGDEYQILID